MFSPLIVIYLFLAGAGCGAFVAAVYLSWRARTVPGLAKPLGRIALPALVASCGMVAVGATCLLLDLGRPELALEVLLNPAGSVLSVGAWALVAFVGAAVLLIACNTKALRLGRGAVLAVKTAGCASAVVVMVYSGLFLSTIWTLPFLGSPLVPVLFVCSSLSCGGGVLLILPLVCDAPSGVLFRAVARVDAVLLVLEALALTALLLLAMTDPLSSAAAARLVTGDLAPVFWSALAVAGLAAPFVLELAFYHADARTSACIGILLLLGGFFLRYCLCMAPFMEFISYL